MDSIQSGQRNLYMQPGKASKLFWLCWLAYFASYLGRLNYAAIMAEIIRAEGFTGTQAGIVGTGFFLCYGSGQMVSGWLGDKLPPKHMITFGLACSALCNAAMAFSHTSGMMLAIWCANGFIQSLLWTPILRIIAEYFAPVYRKKACTNMATTYPAASILVYGGSAGLVFLGGWRTVFLFSAVFLGCIAVVWHTVFMRLEVYRTKAADEDLPITTHKAKQQIAYLPLATLVLFAIALVAQGILRDGVMTWVPAFLTENFEVGTVLAIGTTTLLPLVNLVGVYLAQVLYKHLRQESVVAVLLFGVAGIACLILLWAIHHSLGLSLVCFALVTSCMMGVNLMLVSFVPTYFVRLKRVSFVAGMLNSSVYIGSSLAAFGIGAVVDAFNWQTLLGLLLAVTIAGILTCLLAIPGWRHYRQNNERNE